MQEYLSATVWALDESLAGEFELSATVRARRATVELGRLDRIEHAFAPIDVAGEKTSPHDGVEIVLYLVTCRLQLKDEVRDSDLTARQNDVEQLALPADMDQFPGLSRAARKQEDATSDDGKDEAAKQEGQAERQSRTTQVTFLSAQEQPYRHRNTDDDAGSDQEGTDQAARSCHASSPSGRYSPCELPAANVPLSSDQHYGTDAFVTVMKS